MPTIDINLTEFERLLGIKYHGDLTKLDQHLAFVKGEVKTYNEKEDALSVEMKDTNRPDLWGVEGLSRGLRSYLNLEQGPRRYEISRSFVEVFVNAQLKGIRPYIGCSVVENIRLTDPTIRGLMHLQDKLDQTYGRRRQKTSIGIYCLDLLKTPLKYTVGKPSECRFVPLGFNETMSLAEILERHPKGQEYGHIVNKHSAYPILVDSENKVLSFPPIINSNDLGKVTEETRNLLVEVTGTSNQTVLNTLNLVTTALVDRGGKASSAIVHYPKDLFYTQKEVITPDFNYKCLSLNIEYVHQIVGIQITGKEICELLKTAGLGVGDVSEKAVDVLIPCYRVDIMHPIDVVEDIAVAYGYNQIDPLWRDLPTTGYPRPEQQLINIGRELMVGLGYQEILSNTLTNPTQLFTNMNLQLSSLVEIANPKLVTMTALRSALLPGLMEFLSVNQSIEFPQRIFELGKVTFLNENKETKTVDEERLAAASSHANAGLSEIKGCLESLFMNLGVPWQIQPTSNPSFIEGRAGKVLIDGIEIGLVGEIHPLVLEAWKLENPTVVFEVNYQRIIELKKNMSR